MISKVTYHQEFLLLHLLLLASELLIPPLRKEVIHLVDLSLDLLTLPYISLQQHLCLTLQHMEPTANLFTKLEAA